MATILPQLNAPLLDVGSRSAIERYVRTTIEAAKNALAIYPEFFGVVEGDAAGANAAANDAAWLTLVAYLETVAVNASGNFQGLPEIKFGAGTYEFSSVLDFTVGSVNVSGVGMGHIGSTVATGSTRFKFYGPSGGLRTQYTNTSNISTKDASNHVGGTRSSFRDFSVEGVFSGTEDETYGIHIRASVDCANVAVCGFGGEAWRVEANSSAPGGDATSSTFTNCHGWGSRNGVLLTGNNTGSSVFIGGSFNNNRRWGVKNLSSIGSMFFGVETSNNGTVAENDGSIIPATVVSDGVNRFFCIAGQEVGAATNGPAATATDNAWWAFLVAGASASGIPLWTSGMLVDTGGNFRGSGSNLFSGCYGEANNQGKAQGQQSDVILGGKLALNAWSGGTGTAGITIIKGGTGGTTDTLGCWQAISGLVTAKLGDSGGNVNNRVLFGSHSTIAPSGYSWFFNGNEYYHSYAGSLTSTNAIVISGPNTAEQFNTGVAVPQVVHIRRLSLPSSIGGAISTGRQVCRAGTSSATYVAASGGTTIDTQCRASQVQLATDLADMKAKLQAANLMS
jgi:hypothetical protein